MRLGRDDRQTFTPDRMLAFLVEPTTQVERTPLQHL